MTVVDVFFRAPTRNGNWAKIEKNYKSWVWLEFTQPEMLNLGQFLGSECGQLAPLPRSSRAQCRPSILEANSAGYGEANMSQLPIATIHCHDFWCIAYYFLYFLGSVIYLIYTYSLYPSIKSRFLFLTFPRDFAILAPPPPRSRWNHRHWNPPYHPLGISMALLPKHHKRNRGFLTVEAEKVTSVIEITINHPVHCQFILPNSARA